jgi:predicted ArsR family transcriptional regulator
MRDVTKAGLIRAALAEGPATTLELALELGMPRNAVAAQLSMMCRRDAVRKKPMVGADGYHRNLWSLGRAA